LYLQRSLDKFAMLRAIILMWCVVTVFAQWNNKPAGKPAGQQPAHHQPSTADNHKPPQPKSSCGIPEVHPDEVCYTPGAKIVGGKKAAERSWPWICALIQSKPGYYPYQFCGSTILNKQWIVTAGHCVDSLSEEEIVRNVKVVCGTNNLITGFMKMDQHMFNVSRCIKHEKYDVPEGSTNHDIALIKLATPLKFSRTIQPICLPSAPMEDKSKCAHIDRENAHRRVGLVGGWGHKAEGQKNDLSNPDSPKVGAGSDTLQCVNVDMYNHTECKKKLRGYMFTDMMACGGFDKGGKDSCQGDSGGPLISKRVEGFWELIGVVSWGAGCARANMPGIYADVYKLKPWLQEKINSN
jgi:secreted trypsin-like serine protease